MAGMTIRDIGIMFGFELDKSSEQNVESSVNSLKSFAAKALGAIGVSLSIAGISNALKECATLASSVEEMESKFNTVFDGMEDEVDAWAQNFADAAGRSKDDIKTYLADMQNLIVGFGAERDAGAELSEQLTTLALDLASFSNLDEATAVNAMTKAVMGETESAKTLGAVLNETTRAEAMATLGLSGKYDELSQLNKMQVNYQAILTQSPDAIGDCVNSYDRYESTLRRFNARLKEVKVMIGQFFLPTFKRVLSFGANGLTALRNGIQKIQDFADSVGGAEKLIAVFGAALAATIVVMNAGKIVQFAQSIKKLATAFGGAAKKALIFFAIFLIIALIVEDFIAFMKGDNSVIGAIFEKAGIDADEARQTIINAWNKVKTFLSNVWEVIKGVAETVWGSLTDWWAENGESVKENFSRIWEGIKTICSVVWEVISTIAQTVFTALQTFWETWGSTIMEIFSNCWNTLIALIDPFLTAIANIIEFLANVFTGNWEGAWESVKEIANSIWEMITTLISGAWDNIKAVWDKLSEVFGGIFQAAWDVITEKVTGIKDSIEEGFQEAIDWITSLPEKAVQWGADIIQGIIDGINSMISSVTEAVSGVASKISGFLGFSEPEEGPLSDFHTYMPDMIDLMTEGITAGKKKVTAALEGMTGDMSVIAKANVVSSATVKGMTGNTTNSRTVNQTVEINNNFSGDRAGQQKSSEAMDKAADDATSRMARALAFAR